MKYLLMSGALLSAIFPGMALAICTDSSQITGAALDALLNNNTVCATRGSERWQEQHRSGGQLWDFKLGANHPVDPTSQVGTWSIIGNVITYSYTGGASHSYTVHGPSGGPYSFCTGVNGSEVASNAVVLNGSTGCP